MRIYLDTNILIFLLWGEKDELSADTAALFAEPDNIMFTSTVCVHEIIHLFQIGKLPVKRKGRKMHIDEIGEWLKEVGIIIMPVTLKHLTTLATLPFNNSHRDPNDRLIIAQAISDRIPLVSSDRKFNLYKSFGLEFVYNKR